MSKILSCVKKDGVQDKPIRSKKPASTDIVFVDQFGNIDGVSRASIVRFNRKAELGYLRDDGGTCITITFAVGTWKIRGNRAAMDLIQKLFFDHLLHWVEVTPNADPDRDEQSKTPVIYAIRQVVLGQPPR